MQIQVVDKVLITRIAELRGGNGEQADDAAIANAIKVTIDKARSCGVPIERITDTLRRWNENWASRSKEFPTQERTLAGLRYVLLASSDATPNHWRRIGSWIAEHWSLSSAIAFVIAGAAARALYSAYYEEFGLSPEDVGIDLQRILLGSAPGILMVVLMISLLLALLCVPFVAFNDARRVRLLSERPVHQSRVAVVFCVAVFLASLVAFVVYFDRMVELLEAPAESGSWSARYTGAVVGAFFGMIGGALGGALAALVRAILLARRGLKPYLILRWRSYAAMVLSFFPVVLLVAALFLPIATRARASEVKEGHANTPVKVIGLPILDLTSDKATIAVGPAEIPPGDCYIQLGTGNAYTWIYNYQRRAVFQVPRNDLVLELGPPASSCP